MSPIARIAGVSLDCADHRKLAAFYQALLDLEVVYESDDSTVLKGDGIYVATLFIDGYRPPEWPEGSVPKQMHFEMAVDDLDVAEAAAVKIGATRASSQASPESWRVLFDPAGHPFCISTMFQDD
jgi:catechol-2,3-dioxygenase